MKTWQERCQDVIEFLESYFPEVQYRITFRKDKVQGWIFIVESVRNDKGPHQFAATDWIQVNSDDVEQLPDKMLVKARERIMEWQKDGLNKVREQAQELEKARNELEKRLNANAILAKLEKAVTGEKAANETGENKD